MTVQTAPWDVEAEESCIAACFVNDAADVAAVLAIVEPADFYSRTSAEIFEAVRRLVETGQPVDLALASSVLRDTGKLAMVGGTQGMHDLVHRASGLHHATHYAMKVRELAQLRKLLAASQEIVARIYARTEEPSALVARAEKSILSVTAEAVGGGAVSMLAAAGDMSRVLESTDRGVMTGFAALDRSTAGLMPGQTCIVAARPGQGKSAFIACIAANVAAAGRGVLVVSLEMQAWEIMQRLVSARSRVPLQAIRERSLTPAQWSRVTLAQSEIAELPILCLDKPSSLRDIAAEARRAASTLRRAKLSILIVDHLGLILPSVRGKTNREQEISEISRGLKNLSVAIGAPIIICSQVGRDVGRGGGRRPSLVDLRDSGAVEQDADIVLGLHRQAAYDLDAGPEMQQMAELSILKQRSGTLGVIPLLFEGEFCSFSDARH